MTEMETIAANGIQDLKDCLTKMSKRITKTCPEDMSSVYKAKCQSLLESIEALEAFIKSDDKTMENSQQQLHAFLKNADELVTEADSLLHGKSDKVAIASFSLAAVAFISAFAVLASAVVGVSVLPLFITGIVASCVYKVANNISISSGLENAQVSKSAEEVGRHVTKVLEEREQSSVMEKH